MRRKVVHSIEDIGRNRHLRYRSRCGVRVRFIFPYIGRRVTCKRCLKLNANAPCLIWRRRKRSGADKFGVTVMFPESEQLRSMLEAYEEKIIYG